LLVAIDLLKGRSIRIVLVAFDLLYLNGQDLRRLPLTTRKAELKKIVAGSDIKFSDSFTIGGREMFKHACRIGLERSARRVAVLLPLSAPEPTSDPTLGTVDRSAALASQWLSTSSSRPE
jgi:hypothetical protein